MAGNYQYFNNKEFLTTPSHRAAYSDRMAYLLAQLSDLAYRPIEVPQLVNEVVTDPAPGKNSLEKLIGLLEQLQRRYSAADPKQQAELIKLLAPSGLKLLSNLKPDDTNYTDTQGLILTSKPLDEPDFSSPLPPMVIVAFRGTEKKWADVKTDLSFNLVSPNVSLPNVKWAEGAAVHEGFVNGFSSIEQNLTDALKPYAARDIPIVFTGHSLGGALATLACLYYEQFFNAQIGKNPVSACYTFGAPRLGNTALQGLCKVPVYRYVNAADPVPRLPPEAFWAKFGMGVLTGVGKFAPLPGWVNWIRNKVQAMRSYCHQGSERFLLPVPDAKDELEMSAHLSNAPAIVANPSAGFQVISLWHYVLRRAKTGFVKDHSIRNYIIKLEHWTTLQNPPKADGALDAANQANTLKQWMDVPLIPSESAASVGQATGENTAATV